MRGAPSGETGAVDSVTRVRRTYNQWVANETLEDFALRFTARRARRWSFRRVANTAIGSISFLALEAIGGTLTISFGFDNAAPAILIVGAILFLTGLPICYHAAKAGVDIDLLTRGAGFGYLGSTATSLIYASFTFIFFALEAAILSQALEFCFGVPFALGYILNALIVIPLVTHGFRRIGEFQKWTQPVWAALQAAPFLVIAVSGADLSSWFAHPGRLGAADGGANVVLVAAAAGIGLSLIAQIGEQVDFLRFLPEPTTRRERLAWWSALIAAGPGWAALGTLKMLAGSYLAVMLVDAGASLESAVEPTQMYFAAFSVFARPEIALALAGLFVVLAQLKINVTNAYAGSIAWSNFFSRLTHSHPGRVVWLVFNVLIALGLMEFGVFGALENTLAIYSHVAVAWIGAVTADLVINLPLGLRPKQIEFRRAYLYDINPVGAGSMLLATAAALACFLGLFGPTVAAFSSFVALCVAMAAAPLIALATRGRYYLAREPQDAPDAREHVCGICRNAFDAEDMVGCPYHDRKICSLCCSLEARCEDLCKPWGRVESQTADAFARLPPSLRLPATFARYQGFFGVAGTFAVIVGAILLLIYQHFAEAAPDAAPVLGRALTLAFALLLIIVGVASWLHALANESRRLANRDRERQTNRLLAEIRAHRRTDAELQRAKDAAEAANEAKSRYLVGISHELRTPLNAVLGYAQLLENDPTIPTHRRTGVKVIRTSSEHLADLIEGLLDISKIEVGRLEIYRNETSIRDLLEQVAAIFRMESSAKGLAFEMEVSPQLPVGVIADERRLRQILINLLSNAVRYTDAGRVCFEVGYRNEIATFVVSDTGRGIAKADQERIFAPFERIVDPHAPVRGTGLGLTITRLLVDVLGGDLQLESVSGGGSRFQVRLMLPRIVGALATPPAFRRYGYRGERRRVLVVDDNAEHRALLEDALRPLGFLLSMAESGEAALAAAAAAPPDLALIDVAMPGMSGWELAASLRRGAGMTCPIVMISAHAEDDATPGEIRAFHDDFISKPINIEQLLGRIERLLKLEWAQDPPEAAPQPTPAAPAAALDAIEEAAAIGHVRGAQRVLADIDVEAPGGAAFVAAAETLIENIDMTGLGELVRKARRAGDE